MFENLLHPTLLARVLAGLAALGVTLVAAAVGVRVLRASSGEHSDADAHSEARIALERRAELAATLVQAAMIFQLLNVVLSVAAADRLSASVVGAMCAYGVLDLGASGFVMLGVSVLSALACALWLALHRYDLALPEATLTRAKFAALVALAPLLLLDLVLTIRFALSLDLSVVASCCASQLDPAVAATLGAHVSLPAVSFGVAVGAALASIAIALALQHREGPALPRLLAMTTLLAVGASVPAVMGFVAPHVYGSPQHTCPFCLLHADVWGIGWPLFAALFASLALGLVPTLIQGLSRASAERDHARTLQRDAARFGLYAMVAAVLLQVLPVVRYLVVSGGVSVFGT